MSTTYLETNEAGVIQLMRQNPQGPIVMLNLLRFRAIADYSHYPALAPAGEISGRRAYQRYMQHTQAHLSASGGEIILIGECANYFVGPSEEHWDMCLLIKQHSLQSFIDFASNSDYMAGLGHRQAALADSRLLPIIESMLNNNP